MKVDERACQRASRLDLFFSSSLLLFLSLEMDGLLSTAAILGGIPRDFNWEWREKRERSQR